MYDTVNFWIDKYNISDENPFDIAVHLSDVTEHYSEERGRSITGKMDDYSVRIYESGISLKGSLAKFMLSSNIYTLTRLKAESALEKLSDLLNLDMMLAKVTRLDIATVLQTKYPPCNYYLCLGRKAYFERITLSKDTLSYRTQKKQLEFYDKSKQMKVKNRAIPKIFEGNNLLRYELRLTDKLKQQLNVENLNGGTLINEKFYHTIIKCWEEEYKTINKINALPINISTIKSPKKAQEALFAFLLHQKGQAVIDDYMLALRAQAVFEDPKYYTRAYNALSELISTARVEEGGYVQELNALIFEVAKNTE